MLFNQLLLFNSKSDLPNDFFCTICYDICNSPQLISEYFEGEIFCDNQIHKSNNLLSSQFQKNIKFICDLCGKLIQYLHSKNHFEQCSFLIQNGAIINDQFQQNQQQAEKLVCKFCNYICYKPQQQKNEIVCLFCRQLHPEQTYVEIESNLQESYLKFELQCKQCNQNIFIDQLLIHFKKCCKNLIPQLIGGGIIEEKKTFRQKFKTRLQSVNLSIDQYLRIRYDACSSQYQISYQMNQVKKNQKIYNKLEQRLKILSDS